ncbi:hypothetical protein GRX03_04515 [Halovenus sp. WSH3]|uniref:Uncharacterized protein n=1 Tax=Halovenus carboxidivorans TaxID=2692199 RepID=A0A6B0T7K3_9EURY|nr:DUF5793 family protein [Halovenus carboxidivorans]MXR50870.1 hypothetical protein [Halovenus carboxidivorans]
MRRDHFTVAAESLDPADADSPTLDIEYDGPEETLTAQLTEDDEQIPATDIDVAFRFQDDHESPDATGVCSLTHRVTGEYLLEFNAASEEILDLVAAAKEEPDDGSYRICINRRDGEPFVYDLDALLVYDADGNLLRQHSLIPSGVEL